MRGEIKSQLLLLLLLHSKHRKREKEKRKKSKAINKVKTQGEEEGKSEMAVPVIRDTT